MGFIREMWHSLLRVTVIMWSPFAVIYFSPCSYSIVISFWIYINTSCCRTFIVWNINWLLFIYKFKINVLFSLRYFWPTHYSVFFIFINIVISFWIYIHILSHWTFIIWNIKWLLFIYRFKINVLFSFRSSDLTYPVKRAGLNDLGSCHLVLSQ